VCACVFGRSYVCVCVFVRVHVYVHVHACECSGTFVFVCVYVCASLMCVPCCLTDAAVVCVMLR